MSLFLEEIASVFFIKNTRYSFMTRARFVVVVAFLFYVHGKHLRSCRDGQ